MLSIFSVFAVIVISAIVFLYAFIYLRALLNPLRVLPGPSLTNPILGCLLDYKKIDCQILKEISQSSGKYGHIRRAYFRWGQMQLQLADPHWIKHVLVNNSKSYKRGDYVGAECVFAAVGESGLIVVSGETHRRLRRIASPAFTLSTIKKVIPIVEMCGERMCNLLTTIGAGRGSEWTEITAKDILSKVTLDIIGLVAFGYDFRECCSLRTDTFGYELRQLLDFQFVSFLPTYNPLLFIRAFLKAVRYLPMCFSSFLLVAGRTANRIHDLIDEIVKAKRVHWKQPVNGERDTKKSLLDIIFEANDNEKVSDKELHDLLMTFLIAGHETSSLVLSWGLYLLSRYPEHQTKCRQEAQSFFKNKVDESVTWEDMKNLSYLTAVINETLRLYPSVPYVNRIATCDDEIAGYSIPAGTDVLLFIVEMHRNAEYWHHPDDFIPQRFLEPTEDIPWNAFMPFSDGPHKCIGYQMALMEVTYLMACLVRKFEFSVNLQDEYREYSVITMKPKPDLKLLVKAV